MNKFNLPENARGIRLCVIRKTLKGDRLDTCVPVFFKDGMTAIDTLLRRAEISGHVGKMGDAILGDHWADIMTDEHTWVDVLPMSREAWNSLKNHWLRVKIDSFSEAKP